MTEPAAEYKSTQEYQTAFARKPALDAARVARGTLRVLLWLVIAVPSLAAAGWFLYTPRVGRTAALRMAQRELALALDPGETVERRASVSQRRWWRYFHPTYGVLAYTDRRIVWVGALPRTLIEWDSDEPVAFDMRSWTHDSVRIVPATPLVGPARGVALARFDAVRAEEGWRWDRSPAAPADAPRQIFSVGREEWPAVRELTFALERRQASLRADAERERLRAAYEGWLGRQPVYHIVRPGDAVLSVAATYGITPDSLRLVNGIEGDRIRIGQRLLVKPGT